MNSFTVRVELHGASGADYELLHQKMFAAGYKRFVWMTQTATGKVAAFALPTAEYDHESERDVQQIRDQVYAIAASIRNRPWVLVTQVANRALQTAVLQGANAA